MAFGRQGKRFSVPRGGEVAVLSDLHGNAHALEAAASQLEHYNRENHGVVQTVVILGDLFTYGVQPNQIIEGVLALANDYDLWLVVGNHDEFYMPCLGKVEEASDGHVGWIEEVIEWTRARLDRDLLEEIDDLSLWHYELSDGGLLLSHANPFGVGDWTYLNGEDVREQALDVVRDRGFKLGLFGHTHRRFARHLSVDGERRGLEGHELLKRDVEVDQGWWVMNPGSIGQPRQNDPRSSFAILGRRSGGWTVRLRPVKYEPQDQIREIEATAMSSETKGRLIGYLSKSQ